MRIRFAVDRLPMSASMPSDRMRSAKCRVPDMFPRHRSAAGPGRGRWREYGQPDGTASRTVSGGVREPGRQRRIQELEREERVSSRSLRMIPPFGRRPGRSGSTAAPATWPSPLRQGFQPKPVQKALAGQLQQRALVGMRGAAAHPLGTSRRPAGDGPSACRRGIRTGRRRTGRPSACPPARATRGFRRTAPPARHRPRRTHALARNCANWTASRCSSCRPLSRSSSSCTGPRTLTRAALGAAAGTPAGTGRTAATRRSSRGRLRQRSAEPHEPARQLRDQPGLADPSLAGDQPRGSAVRMPTRPRRAQSRQIAVTPDQRQSVAAVWHDPQYALHRNRRCWAPR